MLDARCAPQLGEKRGQWKEQEKSFSTQTRVLGHATPPSAGHARRSNGDWPLRAMEQMHQHKGVLWVPPEAPAGSGAEEVCVHVQEHGWLTYSTSWEAHSKRD